MIIHPVKKNRHLLINQEQRPSLARTGYSSCEGYYMKFLSCLEEDQGHSQQESQHEDDM